MANLVMGVLGPVIPFLMLIENNAFFNFYFTLLI